VSELFILFDYEHTPEETINNSMFSASRSITHLQFDNLDEYIHGYDWLVHVYPSMPEIFPRLSSLKAPFPPKYSLALDARPGAISVLLGIYDNPGGARLHHSISHARLEAVLRRAKATQPLSVRATRKDRRMAVARRRRTFTRCANSGLRRRMHPEERGTRHL
jgi:hypothetical protein